VTRTSAPYGTWTSPITADLLVEGTVGLSSVQSDGERLTWNELRPSEGARQVIVGARPSQQAEDLLAAPLSARTAVHEYGGRCYALHGAGLVSSNWADQRLWWVEPGRPPAPISPEPPSPRSVRYADPSVTPDGRWVLCVRERHLAEGVVNDLVAVALDGSGTLSTLTGGHDFYSAPTLSPDGTRLAWLSWDHPDMPWDSTELWVADLGADAGLSSPTRVAGGPEESIGQPRWSPEGVLHWVSDRSGWWNLYAQGVPVCPMEAELNEPGWVFGTSTYAFLADGRIVAAWSGPAGSGIGLVADGRLAPIETPYRSFTSLCPSGEGVACIASSPTEAPAVVRIDLDGSVEVLRRSRDIEVDPGYLSTPERVRFPTGDGEHAFALVYPPANADFDAPADELPPLVVLSHGGPTSAASSALNLGVQYLTSRGFAVADVDYRGSTGYGRAYRNRLRDNWGVCDVEDCSGVARWLAAEGRVDGSRCVIRGGSAGGYTTLACLAFTDVFAAGANLFGVADLAALARDTHKFESRYLDRLVGPWPEAEPVYRARSPIHHLDRFSCPLIIFQGLEDVIVPPAQSEMIRDALAAKGVPVAYLPFEGEQHGFRRAESIRLVALAEVSFYGLVLGFTPAETVELPVENAEALPRP
jgi:dipeptidyl aminopeptidase/acylaminoacyl peptidase